MSGTTPGQPCSRRIASSLGNGTTPCTGEILPAGVGRDEAGRALRWVSCSSCGDLVQHVQPDVPQDPLFDLHDP